MERFVLKKEYKNLLISFVSACIVIWLLFSHVCIFVSVNGLSMYPTVYDKDKIIVRKLLYTPNVGDVVVFFSPTEGNPPFIKRIIATEGEHVAIDYDKNLILIDGVPIDEPYINPTDDPLDGERFGVYRDYGVVPTGCYFVLGDNRNNSVDSRDVSVGFIKRENIIGKAVLIMLPLSRVGAVN